MRTKQPRLSLEDYYAQRAKEYEEIYFRDDPIRKREQLEIQHALKQTLKGKDVLEIACGTGYWTKYLSETAKSIVATDFNSEVLSVARSKKYTCPVSFQVADAYKLEFKPRTFTGGLANLWFSHIPKAKTSDFLKEFHKTLKSQSTVFMADNVYVQGLGGELLKKTGDENTYKPRTLKDGTRHEVLKNYYTAEELAVIFKHYDPSFSLKNVFPGKCFWYVIYKSP